MTYRCDLGMGQYLSVENRDENGAEHTVVTLATSSPGQQQQSSCRLTTGRWLEPPQVFRSGHRVVLKLITAQGDRFIYIEGNGITTAPAAVDLSQAQPIPMAWVEPIASSMPPMSPLPPMSPISPLPPMPPMTPLGNGAMSMETMQMSMQPMEMRLGNMTMRADAMADVTTAASAAHGTSQASAPSVSHATSHTESGTPSASSSPRFCSQCGAAVKSGDRFCASCGHRLG